MATKISGTIKKVVSYWKVPPEGRYLTYKEMGAYSAGGMGVHWMMNLTYLFISAQIIPYMYGIKAIHGTIITIVYTLLNLAVQPLFGKVLDNLRSTRGKFKPFIAIVTPIAGLFALLAMWTPQLEANNMRLVYAYLTSIPAILLLNFLLWLFNTLATVMTPNTEERTDLFAVASLIVSLPPTILNFFAGPLRKYYVNQGAEYKAFRLIGIICVILGIALTYLIIFFVKERMYITVEQKNKVKFKDGIKQVFKNKPFIVMQIANMIGILKLFINSQMTFVANIRYAEVYGEGENIRSLLSLVVGFGATPGMILAPVLARKFDKKKLLIFSQLTSLVPLVIILAMGGVGNVASGPQSIILFTVFGFLANFATGVQFVLTQAMGAEQFDYQQYLTGQRQEGFMNTVGAWTAGLGGSLLTLIPTLIQTKIGFQQGNTAFSSNLVYLSENMSIAVKWFNVAIIFTVVSSLLWSLILGVFYRLTAKQHKEYMANIAERSIGNTFEDESAFAEITSALQSESAERVKEEFKEGKFKK